MWCREVKPLVSLLDVAGLGGIQTQAAGSAALGVSLPGPAWALELSAQDSPLQPSRPNTGAAPHG